MIVPRSHASTLKSIVYWIVQKNFDKKMSIDDLQMGNKDGIKRYCSQIKSLKLVLFQIKSY